MTDYKIFCLRTVQERVVLVLKSQRGMINISGGLPLVSSCEIKLFCSRKCHHITTLLRAGGASHSEIAVDGNCGDNDHLEDVVYAPV